MTDDSDRRVADQIVYYRRRAKEYDATFPDDAFRVHLPVLRKALADFGPRGRVLEIACGTGVFTEELLSFADEITALDASPEMLEQHRRKIQSNKIRRVEADIFSWEPDGQYDVVFFSALLSHVPSTHFERFWDVVREALAPSGRVFLIDEGRHSLWDEEFVDEATGVVQRRLLDGTEHRAIKVIWDPRELEMRLRDLGWNLVAASTGPFLWATGRPGIATDC